VPARRRGPRRRRAGAPARRAGDRRQLGAPHRAGLGLRPAELTAGQPARIAAATRISNPGCYPTGALALLRPLVDAGLLPPTTRWPSTRCRATRAAARPRIAEHEAPAPAAPPLQVYGLGLDHKHVPEIQHHAGLQVRPIFLPAYGALPPGHRADHPLHLRPAAGRPTRPTCMPRWPPTMPAPAMCGCSRWPSLRKRPCWTPPR
jgi:N-acetyl-gamma-glutamyl-phosphate reductase